MENKTLISLIFILIMVFGTAGYAILSRPREAEENVVSYDGFKFFRTAGGWKTTIEVGKGKYEIFTYHLPDEVENISINGSFSLQDFTNKALYVVISNENDAAISSELITALQPFLKRYQFACPKEKANESFCIENDLPLKSCEDAGFDKVIVMLEKGNETEISFENGCLRIKGKDNSELIKACEKAIFVIFRIL